MDGEQKTDSRRSGLIGRDSGNNLCQENRRGCGEGKWCRIDPDAFCEVNPEEAEQYQCTARADSHARPWRYSGGYSPYHQNQARCRHRCIVKTVPARI